MPDDHIEALSLIADRYKVMKKLGAGSFGSVYACHDWAIGGRLIALKLFPSSVSCNPDARARISAELQCAFRINHDNVARFYEPVTHEELVGYTMEFVSGGTLREYMALHQKCSGRAAVDVLLQISAGLKAIHEAGIIHGDLKPENIMYTQDSVLKISDFGLAKQLGAALESAGGEGSPDSADLGQASVYGTLEYVSPEYFTTGECDERSDIYALGVIGYELATGRRLLDEKGSLALVHKKVTRNPPRLDADALQIPPDLAGLIRSCLDRDPDNRPQSAEEIKNRLRAVLQQIDAKDRERPTPVKKQVPKYQPYLLLTMALIILVFLAWLVFHPYVWVSFSWRVRGVVHELFWSLLERL
jgi:serine/threonine protein kinase